MFDQVRGCTPTAWDFYAMSFHPFIFDNVIEQKIPKVHNIIQILIGGHAHNRIFWTVDLRHGSSEVDATFKSNKPNSNNIQDILITSFYQLNVFLPVITPAT